MSEIEYCRAGISEVDDLVEQRILFIRDTLPNLSPERERAFLESLRDYYAETIPTEECIYWLARSEGRTIAGGGMARRRYAPGLMLADGISFYIFNIYTDPAFRRRGIAREIMNRLLDEARRKGVCRVDMHATEAGRPLYEKLGFKPPDHIYLEWTVD